MNTCAPDIYGPYWTLSAVSHRVYCGWVRVLGMHDVHKFGRKFSCRQPKYTWNNTKAHSVYPLVLPYSPTRAGECMIGRSTLRRWAGGGWVVALSTYHGIPRQRATFWNNEKVHS